MSSVSKSPQKSSIWSVPQDKLKIIIRIRPFLNQQQQCQFVQLQNHNTLQIKRPGNYTYMKFNNILPYYSTQKDVFNLLEESVNQFLTGTNITIFAYGQTGAGKTYSIIGNYSSQNQENIYHLLASEERGILSRSLQMIMDSLTNHPQARLFMSFYEIYNQKIYDLYNNQGSSPLQIRESKNGQISIPNLITIQIKRIQQAIHYLMMGLKKRSTGSTHANAKSSRSHSIFQICFQKNNQTSSLRIVDLAGSQKFKIPSDITAAQKQIRIQQLTNINGSLSCLGHCISALIEKSRTHIPFRNSKLTRILSDSLLGQGKMRFIICISPSITASAQTFSTLQFANRAKRAIFQRVDIKTPQMSKKKSESQQMLILRKELQKQRQLRENYQQQLTVSKKQNSFIKIQNEKLHHKIRQISMKSSHTSKSIQKSKLTTMYNPYQNDEQQNEIMQSNLHGQMLSLPIFQKNRNLINNGLSCSGSRNKPINLKKAEFQKKIRKFIEQSSPQNKQPQTLQNFPLKQSSMNINKPEPKVSQKLKNPSNSQAIRNQFIKKEKIAFVTPVRQMRFQPEINQPEDSLCMYHQEETQQFFQRACSKMNVKEYDDLKQQMEKAKSQLFKFKQIDHQIEKKKHSHVR